MRIVKWIVIIVLLLGAGAYFGVPAFLETEWARERIRQGIAEGTDREVQLGKLSFSWTSGLVVRDVEVAQKKEHLQTEGPLFSLGSLHLAVSLSDILDQRINVEKLSVEEPRIVVIRDKNGRFNFDDLLESPSSGESPPAGGEAPAPTGEPGGQPTEPSSGGQDAPALAAQLEIEDGRLLYIDQGLGTRIEASDLEAEVQWNDGRLELELTMTLNGGDTRILASADLSRKPAPFEVKEFKIDGAELDAQMAPLGTFVPLMGDAPQQVSGKVNFNLAGLKGEGLDRPSIERTLTGQGNLKLEAGTLASGPIVQIRNALTALGAGDLSALSGGAASEQLSFRLIESTFAIADGKVKTDRLSLTGTGVDLSLTGWTGLDGRIDYDMKLASLDQLLARNDKLKGILGDAPELPFGLTGTLADPQVTPKLEGVLKSAAEGALKKALNDKLGDKIPGGLGEKLPGGLGGLLGGSKDKKKKDKKDGNR